MYYLDQMTEHEIAGELGIRATSVSRHLFGKVRGGKRVGGAIPKLRKSLDTPRPLAAPTRDDRATYSHDGSLLLELVDDDFGVRELGNQLQLATQGANDAH